MDLFRLDGKVAAVIGGARNLGYDMAEALADSGCDVMLTSRFADHAEEAAARLSARCDRQMLGEGLDVRRYGDVEALAAKVRSWKGHVDILINNAGGTPPGTPGPLFDRSPEDIEALIALNLTGAIFCCKAFGRLMAEQGYGKIINISSIAALVGRDRRMYQRNGMAGQAVDYAAAKAGVLGMTRDLAALLAPMGVRVNAIAPGGFGPRDLPQGFVESYSERTPLGHMGRDGLDLKGAAVFLSSPASDYISGHTLVVDGGFSIWQ
ncbi:MAG: SDR family oxidoreductase [Candidatus Hydrogenedentes bacterium]|nr:SDR family oxidoreductase [Candidatus Hydrogenedentota bacterium]